jgi:hypothetical protein
MCVSPSLTYSIKNDLTLLKNTSRIELLSDRSSFRCVHFISMFIRRQFRRQQQQRSTSTSSDQSEPWKVRPIYGFEKFLFPNVDTPITLKRIAPVDPARFIYPRDAMGSMLDPSPNRTMPISTVFYLPKDDFSKSRSPAWTISNVHHSNSITHHVGPMAYDSVNDTSQLSCKSGWTQRGRGGQNIRLGLTVPFYDTTQYKAVGDPCSVSSLFCLSFPMRSFRTE